jgi:hypothetical protein
LKRVKRNPNRQHNARHVEPLRAAQHIAKKGKGIENPEVSAEKVIDDIRDEIGIFEIKEEKPVDYQPDNEVVPLPFFGFHSINQVRLIVIEEGREEQNEDKQAARFVVKEQADDTQPRVSHQLLVLQPRKNRKHQREKHPEIKLREQQRRVGVECEYIL